MGIPELDRIEHLPLDSIRWGSRLFGNLLEAASDRLPCGRAGQVLHVFEQKERRLGLLEVSQDGEEDLTLFRSEALQMGLGLGNVQPRVWLAREPRDKKVTRGEPIELRKVSVQLLWRRR